MTETPRKSFHLPAASFEELVTSRTLELEGSIPSWLKGRLLRIGPGLYEFGEHKAKYPMDGMGLIHQFNISAGSVEFQSRYLQSHTYSRNIEEKRFVHAEFGTPASPDPKQGLLARIKTKISGIDVSDNCNHNLFYWKDLDTVLVVGSYEFFVIDRHTLETKAKIKLPEGLGVDLLSPHVQIDKDGCCYALGSHVKGRPSYHIIKIPNQNSVAESCAAATVVASIPGQFKVSPCSLHSFVMTESFFVIIETPLSINIMKIITKSTVLEAIEWEPEITVKFHVIRRDSGQRIMSSYEASSFYYLHCINAFEQDDHIVIDLIALSDFTTKDLFFTNEAMSEASFYENPHSMKYKQEPRRYILPLDTKIAAAEIGANAVKLDGQSATAVRKHKCVFLTPSPLTDQGQDHLEYPCINQAFTNKPYQYLYAGGMGRSNFLPWSIGKFDIASKTVVVWKGEKWSFLSEPIFIRNPHGTAEDDGVLLVSMTRYNGNRDMLLFLDARSLTKIAHASMEPQVPIPFAEHGVFIVDA